MMAKLRPTQNMAALPIHGLHDLLTCIRCGKIPNPKDFMVCDERGHQLCGPCTAGPTKGTASSGNGASGSDEGKAGGRKKNKLFFPEKILEECCAPKNLRRGSPLLLQALLDAAVWKCPNEGNGCTERFLGSNRDKHLGQCKFRAPNKETTKLRCYFDGCAKFVDDNSGEELIQHYKEVHKVVVLEWKDDEIGLKLDFQQLLEKRHVSLIKLDDSSQRLCHFFILFCEVCEDTEVLHIWLRNMSPAPPSSEASADKEEERLIIYQLKLIQVKAYDGVRSSDLKFRGASLPQDSTPEEIIRKSQSHFKIGLEKLFNSCVESTPNGHGNLNVSLKLGKKEED